MSLSHLGAFFDIDIVGGGFMVVNSVVDQKTTFTYTGTTTNGGTNGAFLTLKDEYDYDGSYISNHLGNYLEFFNSSPLEAYAEFCHFQVGYPASACTREDVEDGYGTLQGFYLSGGDRIQVSIDHANRALPDCPLLRKFRIAFQYNYTRPAIFSLWVTAEAFIPAATPQQWRQFRRAIEVIE
jgi:hypothetical protein